MSDCFDRRSKLYMPSGFAETLEIDPSDVTAFADQKLAGMLVKIKDRASSEATVKKFKVRFKPVEVTAIFIDDHHLINAETGRRLIRKSGWIIQGPGRNIFYLDEQYFSKNFEIVEEGE